MAAGHREVAVRILPLLPADTRDGESLESLEKEIELMRSFDHPHVVEFFDAFIRNDCEIWVVMERCQLGSVHDLARLCTLSDVEVGAMCHGVLLGLRYLHEERRTIHRDIKGPNVLLTSEGVVKLADFGVSAVTQGTLAQARISRAPPSPLRTLWHNAAGRTAGQYRHRLASVDGTRGDHRRLVRTTSKRRPEGWLAA